MLEETHVFGGSGKLIGDRLRHETGGGLNRDMATEDQWRTMLPLGSVRKAA
jgi:hypothetical protein